MAAPARAGRLVVVDGASLSFIKVRSRESVCVMWREACERESSSVVCVVSAVCLTFARGGRCRG
jgi:hypothetical protein